MLVVRRHSHRSFLLSRPCSEGQSGAKEGEKVYEKQGLMQSAQMHGESTCDVEHVVLYGWLPPTAASDGVVEAVGKAAMGVEGVEGSGKKAAEGAGWAAGEAPAWKLAARLSSVIVRAAATPAPDEARDCSEIAELAARCPTGWWGRSGANDRG